MRILQVFDFISLRRGGGTLSLLSPLARTLAQRGHRVTLYTTDFEVKPEHVAALAGVSVHPFHDRMNLFGFQITPDIIREARNSLGGFDVIHLHCFRSFQNVVIHHYARRYGVPYIVDAHGSLPRTAKKAEWLKGLMKWAFDFAFGYRLLKDAARVVAETGVGVGEYEAFGVSRDRIVLLPPPFPVEDFADLPPPGLFRARYHLEDRRIVMFLGRIHWIKGLDFLVASFHELARVRSDVTLVIVGPDDGYQASLEALIRRLNLTDKVVFTGFLGGREKLSALSDADVVVQTSVYEQGAWAPFEAVLCHTPIIVNSKSGAGEDVKGIDAGYLAEYGNKNELRDIMQYVLEHPEEARNKAERARDYIEKNLSLAQGIEKYEKLYHEVIEGKKR